MSHDCSRPHVAQESLLRAGAIPNAGDWGTETITAEVSIGHADGTMSSRHLPLSRGLWPDFYAAVRDSILHNAPAPVPLNDVIANLRVLDAARTSASTSQRVHLDSAASHE